MLAVLSEEKRRRIHQEKAHLLYQQAQIEEELAQIRSVEGYIDAVTSPAHGRRR